MDVAAASPQVADHATRVRRDICERLDPEQVAWLQQQLVRSEPELAIAYRASTSVFGKRFFIAVLAGRELRSAKRLQDEGLSRRFGAVAFELGIMALAAALLVGTLVGGIAGVLWLLDYTFGFTNLPDYLDKLFH